MDSNMTIVSPAYFIIMGLSGIPHVNYYYLFLLVLYIMSVVENGIVMALICFDQSLKTPKYIAVFNLVFVDVVGSSALVPKVIDTFWFDHKYISYSNCLTYSFFYYVLLTMQSLNLALLSFDRLIAITFPLRYQIIVSLKTMFSLVAACWIISIFDMLVAVGFLIRLSFCRGFLGTPHINYYYFFLLVLYIMSVVENGVVMALICLDQSLKTPKYIAVFNLAFVDVVGSSALVPKVIDTFWFDHKYISYSNCLTYEFFNFLTLTMQSLNLVVLSFDRLVAITFPLRYQIIQSYLQR
ncbi:unnamed protein product [Boreogadus saida]